MHGQEKCNFLGLQNWEGHYLYVQVWPRPFDTVDAISVDLMTYWLRIAGRDKWQEMPVVKPFTDNSAMARIKLLSYCRLKMKCPVLYGLWVAFLVSLRMGK